MQIFGITLETRDEKLAIIKQVIESLHIGPEEKDLYMISLTILSDHDFSIFFQTIMSQMTLEKNTVREFSIEPLTSQII